MGLLEYFPSHFDVRAWPRSWRAGLLVERVLRDQHRSLSVFWFGFLPPRAFRDYPALRTMTWGSLHACNGVFGHIQRKALGFYLMVRRGCGWWGQFKGAKVSVESEWCQVGGFFLWWTACGKWKLERVITLWLIVLWLWQMVHTLLKCPQCLVQQNWKCWVWACDWQFFQSCFPVSNSFWM